VVVSEPKVGTPERKAIMDAMRGPVAAHVGKKITFTGDVQVSGNWARFRGDVPQPMAEPPRTRTAPLTWNWTFMRCSRRTRGCLASAGWGFAGDIGVSEAAREKYPKAPWVLFE